METDLGHAKVLCGLSNTTGDHASSLAAASVLAAAAALDSGLKTELAFRACTAAFEADTRPEFTEFGKLAMRSLTIQMFDYPTLATEGRFSIPKDHENAGDLRSLIKLRNQLVHTNQKPIYRVQEIDMDVPNPSFRFTGKLPSDPWESLASSDVQRYLEVAELYLKTLIDVADDALPESPLLEAFRR